MAPRILIFGTGGIGASYAYLLSRAIPASNITTVCRSNYAAASQNGFTIHSTLWGTHQTVKPTVVSSVPAADPSSPFDYILVTSKVLPTSPSTPELIAPAVSPGTVIVLVQNGIAIEEPYREMFPENPLLSTVVYLPATQIEPGVVQHKEMELLHIGPYPSSKDTREAEKLAALLRSVGATAKVHEDVQFERWSKLLINASWNPICALSRSRDAFILQSSPEAHSMIRDVMLEIASVAHACGEDCINEELIDFQLGRAMKRGLPGVQPSMMADALEGRRMEVEAIVGGVVRLAREKGVKVPMLRCVYVLANALDKSFARVD